MRHAATAPRQPRPAVDSHPIRNMLPHLVLAEDLPTNSADRGLDVR
jgi:hypothetical protein